MSMELGIKIEAARKDAVSGRPAIGMGALSPDLDIKGFKDIIGPM